MRALDLFCGAGGAAVGLRRAGFSEVVGVDIEDRGYHGDKFIRADVLSLDPQFLSGFDFVWASPPCQLFCAYRRRKGVAEDAVNLIPETRDLLRRSGSAYCIENVTGASGELRGHFTLCGSMFGLDVRRHRIFEVDGFEVPPLACDHKSQNGDYPQATNRKNRRKTCEVGVYRIPLQTQKDAMGWSDSRASLRELSLSIPPAYSEHIGRAFLRGHTK